MISLSRLIRRLKPENISYGIVMTVDAGNKRLSVKTRNNITTYITYSPSEFPDIAVNDVVAVGSNGMNRFLVSRVPSGLPVTTIIVEV